MREQRKTASESEGDDDGELRRALDAALGRSQVVAAVRNNSVASNHHEHLTLPTIPNAENVPTDAIESTTSSISSDLDEDLGTLYDEMGSGESWLGDDSVWGDVLPLENLSTPFDDTDEQDESQPVLQQQQPRKIHLILVDKNTNDGLQGKSTGSNQVGDGAAEPRSTTRRRLVLENNAVDKIKARRMAMAAGANEGRIMYDEDECEIEILNSFYQQRNRGDENNNTMPSGYERVLTNSSSASTAAARKPSVLLLPAFINSSSSADSSLDSSLDEELVCCECGWRQGSTFSMVSGVPKGANRRCSCTHQ